MDGAFRETPGLCADPTRLPFNNPRLTPQSWYPLALSREVNRGQVVSRHLAGRKVAVFRGRDGVARALAAECPHLGADLGRGQVVDCHLRCSNHHWSFDDRGLCASIPSGIPIPAWATTFAYPVEEHFGTIWIFNGPRPLFAVPTFDGTPESALVVGRFPPAVLNVHPHVLIQNGLDLQHFRTVHEFLLEDEPVLDEPDPWRVRVRLHLRLSGTSLLLRGLRLLAGPKLRATFCSWGGNMATIEAESNRLRFYVLFSYVPTTDGRSASRTFVMVPWTGTWPAIPGLDRARLLAVQALVAILLVQDRTILDTIRLRPHLVAGDAGLAAFIQQVNRMPVFDPSEVH